MDVQNSFFYNTSMHDNKVYLDGEGIITIEVIGDQDVASVGAMGKEIESLLAQQRAAGKPCLILDNLLQIGVVGPDARKLVVALGKSLAYDRLAMLGKGGLMRFGANLMLHATGRTDKMRYFDDPIEAHNWLLRQ